jgi:excinuclease ABC subunit A
MDEIEIIRAQEGNLKGISVEIPKNQLVVFTGLSGSGKSTLLVDVLFQECQRQYLEAMSYQGIAKPKVERIRGASPAIVISQEDANKNPRSTVGTMTDVYTDLRMIYEKLGERVCPYCGEKISAADCPEETEKIGNDFHVYMYCSRCGRRMDKLTGAYFSFNTREGACPVCEGLGRIHTIKKEKAVDETRALGEGAVRCWEKQYGKYQIELLKKAFAYYSLSWEDGLPVSRMSEIQKAILYDGTACGAVKRAFPDRPQPKTVSEGKFEGVIPNLWRRFAEKSGEGKRLDEYFEMTGCPECRGERLAKPGREAEVAGVRLPELAGLSLERLSEWAERITQTLTEAGKEKVSSYLGDIRTKLERYKKVGLGYLTLDRQVVTLSGGELQRIRLAAVLDSEMSGIIYILDEPTAGLHPKDTEGLTAVLKRLRDLGNTVLVIEHDEDVIAAADYLIDMGPGAGRYGGEVTAKGTLAELRRQAASPTGRWLREKHPGKAVFREPAGWIHIERAKKYNLKEISVDIPAGCLVTVTGPSGSGKSTLVFEVLAGGEKGCVNGLEIFDRIVGIGQSPAVRMRRSNTATYTEAYGEIRALFAGTEDAKKSGLTAKAFSFNTPGGRCETCEGMGTVENRMLFFANTEVVCPDCGGGRFQPEVQAVKYRGRTIREALDLTVDEAAEFFKESPKLTKIWRLLQDVGLGYLQLGQPLTTLSGGEAQRLKLARELLSVKTGRRNLYLMDEPTRGLHPRDVEHFLILLNRMAEEGNTVVIVEHNQQIIRNSDWIIDLGPDGGENGGEVIFTGTPEALKGFAGSVTARYL